MLVSGTGAGSTLLVAVVMVAVFAALLLLLTRGLDTIGIRAGVVLLDANDAVLCAPPVVL